jgi:hypothetical protein
VQTAREHACTVPALKQAQSHAEKHCSAVLRNLRDPDRNLHRNYTVITVPSVNGKASRANTDFNTDVPVSPLLMYELAGTASGSSVYATWWTCPHL